MKNSQTLSSISPVSQFGSIALKDLDPILQSPLLQSLVWPIFLMLVLAIFRKQLTLLFQVLINQIAQGASLEIGVAKLTPARKFVEETADVIKEVDVVGNPDRFKLLFKVQSKDSSDQKEVQSDYFLKSTKAMEVPGGCIVQVTSERRNPDGTWSLAEALTFVPGQIVIEEDISKTDGKGGQYLTSGSCEF